MRITQKSIAISLLIVVVAAAFIFALNYSGKRDFHPVIPIIDPDAYTVTYKSKELTEFPKSVLTNRAVAILDLSNNKLTAIPAEIRQLSTLRELDLSDNKLTGIPAEIGQLSKLEVLNLSNNQLTGLPYELGNLQRLRVLNLSGNQVSQQDLAIIEEKLPNSTTIIE